VGGAEGLPFPSARQPRPTGRSPPNHLEWRWPVRGRLVPGCAAHRLRDRATDLRSSDLVDRHGRGGTHKTFARTRKLCTQTYTDAQTLLLDLGELEAKRKEVTWKSSKLWLLQGRAGQSIADEQSAARRSWGALRLDLRTTVDTGYRLFGIPFLADSAIADLEKKVLGAIDASDAETSGLARDDLHAVLEACAARIDVLA
jgi:hypothetical protein